MVRMVTAVTNLKNLHRRCTATRFRLFSNFSPAAKSRSVNPLVQTEPSPARPSPVVPAALSLWQWAALAGLSLWLYWSTLTHLLGQWWHDPNFSHGFFVPLFSAFVLWQERDRFARLS